MTTPSRQRNRTRRLKQAGALAAVAAVGLGLGLWSADTSGSTSHSLTVVGIQPQSGEVVAVDSNAVAELHSAASGDLIVYSIANPGGPVSRESTACSSNLSLYACQSSSANAMDQSMQLAGRVASGEVSVPADPYASVRYTASFTASHPQFSDITLWLNLASPEIPASAGPTNLANEVATTVAAGSWPPNCNGFIFHLVVPSTGRPQEDALGKQWWQALIDYCHGTLASYTPNWMGYGTASWNLPKLGHDVGSTVNAGAAKFTVPASVLFALNSSTLSPTAQSALSQIAKELSSRFPGLPVHVFGYTDASGSPAYNDVLSTARASAVATWLSESGGIPADRITSKGLGTTNLLTTPEASRRVEIIAGTTTLTSTP